MGSSATGAGDSDPWAAFRDVVIEGFLLQKRLAHRYGLSAAQYMLLRDIGSRGSARPSDLAEEFGVSPPAMTILVGGLEKRGWVRRSRASDDRRVVRIALAPKAERVLRSIETQRDRIMRATLAPVARERRRELAKTLRLIGARLKDERVRARHLSPGRGGP